MKKLLATILALVMALGLCSVSWAAAPAAYVAEIVGGNQYATLQEAIDAVQDGQSIKLLANVTENGMDIKKNLKIDFDGKILTIENPMVGSAGTVTNGMRFLRGDDETTYTVELINGTIRSSKARILVQNYANLTLNKMTLDLSEQPLYGYVLSNNNGKVMLVDVNITAPSASGSLAFDAGGFDNYAGADVTLTGNSEINGNVGYGVNNSNITGARLTIENGTINGRIIKSDTYETSVKVSGGTFAEPVEARFLAEGLEYEVHTNAGYVYYSDFDTAAAAAATGGDEVIKVGTDDARDVPFHIDYADGTGVKPALRMSKDNFELPTPTRSGYTFKGWKIALHEGEQIPGFTGTYTSEQVKDIVFAEAATDGGAINRFSDGAYLTAVWSANSYYYYPSTSDTTTSTTTKGSPKTFDAGVGIYAVTALLSVTGMAWAGKKRH